MEQIVFLNSRPRMISLFWVVASVMTSLSLPLTACASTGAFAGILEGVGPPRYQGPNDPEKESKLKSLQIRSKFVLYQSNTKHHTGELVTTYQLRSTSSPAIGGHLTSVQAFANALQHLRGHYIFVYEDKHFDLSATPPFTFGLLRDVDMESGELTIDVPQTGLRFHYSENPIVRVNHKLKPDAHFRIEPWQDVPRETVPRMVGRWVQVHPPRRQMIWVESDKAQWNADHLPTRATNATRGGPNSLTHNAMFLRYVPMLFNTYGGRYFLGMEIETIQNTDREKDPISDRFQARPMLTELGDGRVRVARGGRGVELLRGATLDQHVAPGWVTQRPGRSFAANHCIGSA